MLAILILGLLGSVAAIGTYMWSLRVASVKAQAVALDSRIAETRAQVDRLHTELMLRTRLVQQEWWAPTLGLQTPGPMQYGQNGDQLHALADVRRADMATARIVPPQSAPLPVVQQTGYEPKARHALDALIGDLAH